MTMKARPQCRRRLWPYQVQVLRQMRKEGFPRRFMAERFGISLGALNEILSYSTYKDIR